MANNENLKPFQKGPDKRRNMKGRPKKYLTTLKEQGYTLSEINDTLQVIISLNEEQLKKVKDDTTSTILEKVIASALIKSLKNGTMDDLEVLITRVYGKPQQKIEQDVKITSHTIKLKFGGVDINEEESEDNGGQESETN